MDSEYFISRLTTPASKLRGGELTTGRAWISGMLDHCLNEHLLTFNGEEFDHYDARLVDQKFRDGFITKRERERAIF